MRVPMVVYECAYVHYVVHARTCLIGWWAMGWDGGNRARPRGWDRLRKQVWQRDGGACRQCGMVTDLHGGQCDHVVGWWHGGDDGIANLQWLCVACHKVKTRADEMVRREVGKPGHPGLRG